METHFSHTQPFPHISSFTLPERTSSHVTQESKLSSPQSPARVCCRAQDGAARGPASGLLWPAGPTGFCADPCECASAGKIHPSPCWSPQGGHGRRVPSVSSFLVLKMGMGPWRVQDDLSHAARKWLLTSQERSLESILRGWMYRGQMSLL